MIKSIKEIHNLGCYEEYLGNQEVGDRQIIFGFNGSGKSTLSDMFYSLANGKEVSTARKTLDKADGRKSGDISIVLSTDIGDVSYNGGNGWDSKLPVFTFNEQYIRDYVFVNREYKQDVALVTMGSEGVRLSNTKLGFIKERDECINKINNVISVNKDLCAELGWGKIKVKPENINRLETIKSSKLYPIGIKNQIKLEMEREVEFSKEIQILQSCINSVKKINLREIFISVSNLRKILETIPAVRNTEITKHMNKCMKKDDPKWLVAGYYNQKNKSICPYCGQPLTSYETKHLIKEIEKYISSKMQVKAKSIIESAKQEVQFFDKEKIDFGISELKKVLNIIQKEKVLSVTSQNAISNDICWDDLSCSIDGILGKLWIKIENPYEVITLSDKEVKCINALNKISKRISWLEEELKVIYDKTVKKISSEKAVKIKNAIFEASYGGNRDLYLEVINYAGQALKLNEKIIDISKTIDDTFDKIKLKKINELLRELNIKFSLDIEGRQYYIKLKDYKPQKYDKEKSLICSEGEKRILAFSYFWSELCDNIDDKIIVIDDPITSLDLSRKSVIAYRISQLFEKTQDQVIVMTHDIAFVEQIIELSGNTKDTISMIELKNKNDVFYPLEMKDYLMTDEMVYKSFINNAIDTDDPIKQTIGFMSLRPYTSILNKAEYSTIEKESTYFAHTIYSYNKKRNIEFEANSYNCFGLRKYVLDVKNATNLNVDENAIVPDGYCFSGFDYALIKHFYRTIGLDTIAEARMKAMLLRVALEACLFQLTVKLKFDPERIGKEYKNVINSCIGEKKKVAIKLKELYDLSKKYHHGSDEGSTLGLSWINPDEIELFDRELQEIFCWIDTNCIIKTVAA